MKRHEQIIQLSDHVKNKLKQHKHPPATFVSSSDEFIEINSIDDDNELDSLRTTPAENETRSRRDTFSTSEVKKSSGRFFTDRKPNRNSSVSVLQEIYKKQQQQCQECIRRDRIIHLQQHDLLHLYNQNKQLNNHLRSSILLNHRYEGDIQKLKHHLTKINFDHLKQKILSDQKTSPKIDEEQEEAEEEEDKQDETIDHLKRLRYEIQMYNRIVATKRKQEEKIQSKQIDILF